MTRKSTYAIAALLCLLLSANVFGQGTSNATVGGTVSDASGALIPGVTVTATNVATGIVNTVVSNESGAYNFASLQPGDYKVSAELPGFQTQTYTDVKLGGADQVRLNFTLQVAAAAGTNVEVTIAADTVLATSSSVLSTVLPEYKVRDLPALTGNVFNIVQNLPGVQRDGSGTFGYMAGGRLGDVNTTRDGVNVNDGRYENGAWSSVYNSPDMVEEVKVIVAPVDAETSRGSGQVSMVTRSGTNTFRGSVSWSNHNSKLDANDWFNNRTNVGKSYDNRNLYTARLGGPIIKNKTFFFGLFTGQRDLKRTQAVGTTFTDMAKAGIFRYWPGVDVLNAINQNPSVDRAGNPVAPKLPDGSLAGPLSAIGLFGSCNYQGAPVPNCKVYNLDPNRTSISTNAFLQEELRRMPSPNQFNGGDGLNTAQIQFVRRQEGLDLTNGNGDEVNRDQYNLRIDHNFNSKHKISFIGTNEHTWGTATQAGLRAWPLGYDGLAVKRPVLYSLQMTSTLSNSMLNQFRISKSGTNNWQWGSADRGDAIGAEARALHARANGIPYQVTFATGLPSFSNIGGFGRWREGINPRYALGDDLSWTKGKHAFKGGYEIRRTESNGFNDPNYDPVVTLGGGGNNAAVLSSAPTEGNFTGLTTNAATAAKNLLYDLAGSVTNINQAFGVVSAKDTTLVGTPTIRNNRHWNIQYEMSSYFKDDWKFRNDLTLNLGIHWEWYGMPYEKNGLAARVVGDDKTFTNVSCSSTIGVAYSSVCTNLATVQFVGKNSTHPEIGTYVNGNDNNNFAPSIGFAWNVPWFGKGKTVVRSGYGINYEGALRNFITVDGVIGTVPGINLVSGGTGLTFNPTAYTTLSTVSLPIPFPAGTPTTSPFPVTPRQRSLGITTYDRVSPYTQNWNFEIQREIAKGTTVEIRYVGTKGSKIVSNNDLNTLNWIKTDGSKALFDAFNSARIGQDPPLFNQLLNGLSLAGTCVVNGTTCTGAQALRTNATTRAQLANGNFGSFLNALNTGAGGALQYTGQPSTDGAGAILYRSGFPDNYLVPDPQYSSVSINGNNDNSTYHSLNLQLTRRLSHGFTNTTTYIWSKALGEGSSIDPQHMHTKILQAVDHAHQISSNGTYELPFGTGHFLLGNAPSWMQNIVGGWQFGGIMNYLTGAPLSITSGITTITNSGATPNVVGTVPKDMGKLTYVPGGVPNYFPGYTQVTDPNLAQLSSACATSTSATAFCNGLSLGYNNKAICPGQNGVCSGPIFLVNPQPGQVGTLGQTTLRGPSRFDLDMNLVKRFKITERKQFELRLDAINILNHPNFGGPSTALNTSGSFGQITSLASGLNTGGNGGMRSFVINTRLNF